MDELKDIIAVLEDVLEEDDEKLEMVFPALINELEKAFTGERGEQAAQEFVMLCDLAQISPEEGIKELKKSQSEINEIIEELKEKTTNSDIKAQFLDIIANMADTFFGTIALRFNLRTYATLGIELSHPAAKIPTYAHTGDQGADIYAPEANTIPAGARGYMVHTGIKLLIPHGWAVSIRPRSGMSKNTPLRISNSPATIDQQYRGEVCILFDNLSDEPYEIKQGDRIAQMILEKNYHAAFYQLDSVEPTTDRGEGGFGSSGN